ISNNDNAETNKTLFDSAFMKSLTFLCMIFLGELNSINITHLNQFHNHYLQNPNITMDQKWLALQADAFRGHGLSLLTRKDRSLRGLKTRAIPTGVAALRFSHKRCLINTYVRISYCVIVWIFTRYH